MDMNVVKLRNSVSKSEDPEDQIVYLLSPKEPQEENLLEVEKTLRDVGRAIQFLEHKRKALIHLLEIYKPTLRYVEQCQRFTITDFKDQELFFARQDCGYHKKEEKP
jgi:hypothetical protein